MNAPTTEDFYSLAPHIVLDAIETIGLHCTGRTLQLNSLENRVYEIGIEDDATLGSRVAAKFYRPLRWDFDQILDEHEFLFALEDADIPVVCPLEFEGESVFVCPSTGIYFAVFPFFGGRNLDEFSETQALSLGRIFARMHMIGAQEVALHRRNLSTETFGHEPLQYLLSADAIPADIRDAFENAANRLFEMSAGFWEGIQTIRTHGDAHVGNIINRAGDFFFVDFDDMINGPAVQDLWLLAPGRDDYSRTLLRRLLEGYQELRDFNSRELILIEPLRVLRVLHFSAWIHKRWEDQYFQRTFMDFGTDVYWREQLRFLYEQFEVQQNILATGDPLLTV